jgi:hypothetical protein
VNPVICPPGCKPEKQVNGAVLALGVVAGTVALTNLMRREKPSEFFENAAMLALMGAFVNYAQGR